MAGTIGGALTISTEIDNSDLEKGLEEAQKKVEQLKQALERNESEKNAIAEQMDAASQAVDGMKQQVRELEQQIEDIETDALTNPWKWTAAQQQIEAAKQRITELNGEIEGQTAEMNRLNDKWQELDNEAQQYATQLESATQRASALSKQVSSFYYQASKVVQQAASSVSASFDRLSGRISRLVSSAVVFSVLRQGLNNLKNGIVDALMQNDAFSASWTYLSSAVQGFANGVASVVAPVLVKVINGVTACVMTLARAIDSVFKTSLASSIASAQKSAQEAWRQTDASKAAQKSAQKSAEAAQKQQERYEKAQESYRKKQEQAASRLAKAQEDAAERQADAEQSAAERMADAEAAAAKKQQDAEERLAKAQESAAKRQEKAETKAQKRLTKAQESAQKRYDKAEATAAQRTADAQAAYEEKVANATARAEKKREKAAKKLEKAQKKANQTLLGFDELNKMNEDTSEDAADSIDDYADALANIKPPKTYSVDPEDYFVDPADYAIDPADYIVDPEDYAIDPEDLFVDPADYQIDPSDYFVDPEDYAIDPFEFDWDTSLLDLGSFDAGEGLKPDWDAFDVGKIDGKLTEIMAILGAAKLAIGAILAFSGINIPLGIALMALGALELATVVGENWEALPAEVQNAITNALVITGIVMIVLGAAIAFSGVNFAVGIGLMAAGALTEWGAIALNWESMTPEMRTAVTMLMGILGGAFLVIGAIIAFADPDPTHKAIGIGLMVLGAADAAAAIALNWGSMDEQLRGVFTTIMVTLGVFAIVIGVVLLLAVPGQQPLGIGLILTGATMLGAAAALNWETLDETLVPVLQRVLRIVAEFMIVIGVVLLFVPGQLHLGIGLVIGGIAALEVSEILADWNSLDTTLRTHLEKLIGTVGWAAVVLGTILLFIPTQLALGIGLIIFGIAAITTSEVSPEWDSVDNKLQLVLDKLVGTIAKFMIVLGVILLFVPSQLATGIGLIIGGVAILAVKEIAANWDSVSAKLEEVMPGIVTMIAGFMIVLGVCLLLASVGTLAPLAIGLIVGGIAAIHVTEAVVNWDSGKDTIEGKLNELVIIISGTLVVLGIILCLTGVALPLGIGLIAAGAVGLAVEAAINWDFIVDKVKEIWGKVKEFWDQYIAPVFTVQFWEGVFKSIVNGLIGMLNAGLNAAGGFINDLAGGLGDLLNFFGVEGWSFSIGMPQIPYLAQGAVIPPNRKFMAVLGDQRTGTNIETPEGLMRQVVREEVGSVITESLLAMQGAQGPYGEGGDVTLVLQVGHEELARAVSKGNASRLRRGEISADLAFA